MKIHIVMLGKTRRPELRAMMDDYVARIRRFAEVHLTELREDSAASLRKFTPDSAATVATSLMSGPLPLPWFILPRSSFIL